MISQFILEDEFLFPFFLFILKQLTFDFKTTKTREIISLWVCSMFNITGVGVHGYYCTFQLKIAFSLEEKIIMGSWLEFKNNVSRYVSYDKKSLEKWLGFRQPVILHNGCRVDTLELFLKSLTTRM